ncbi:TPA: hypothetical protein VDU83_002657 [Pseudomonas aeruginosa]|nr:hypothetical protein [Pseudomonas aeruginosa]
MSNTQASFSGFDCADAAMTHRAQAGGWIFLSANGGEIWFSTRYTPSMIINHHATAGMSGRLV